MAIARSLSIRPSLVERSGHDIDADTAVARYPSRTDGLTTTALILRTRADTTASLATPVDDVRLAFRQGATELCPATDVLSTSSDGLPPGTPLLTTRRSANDVRTFGLET
jgi:hypothetical protein